MNDTKKMLRAIINGQSAMKNELLGEVRKVDNKVTGLSEEVNTLRKETRRGFIKVTKRIDKVGLQVARLEDDAPTIGEFDGLGKRVGKLEHKTASA